MHLSHVKWLKTFNGRIYFRPVIFVSLQIELSGGSSSRRWFACLVVLNYFLLKFYHSFLSPACYLNFILLWNINFEPSFKYMFWIWTHFHFFFNNTCAFFQCHCVNTRFNTNQYLSFTMLMVFHSYIRMIEISIYWTLKYFISSYGFKRLAM